MSVTPRKRVPPRKIAFQQVKLRRHYFVPRYWGTWIALLSLGALSLLPLPLSRLIGTALGWLMYLVNVKRRRIAQVNLRLCFPDKTERQRARLLRRHYVVFGQSVTDLGHLAWNSRSRLRRMTRFVGIELYREYVERGDNIILLVPHCVGMNFGGAVLSEKHPTFGMYKPQGDPVLTWFLNFSRMRFGAQMFTRAQGLRPVVRVLKEGSVFYYLPDKDYGPKNSVFVPFFGLPMATLPTLGRLARLGNAIVVPCFARVLPWGRGIEVILYPPLEHFPSDDEIKNAARMNRALEEGIRTMPEQYSWTFKIFKTRPGNGPSPYG